MKKTFEDYLQDKHADHYHGFDDDMPEAFDQWISELEKESIITYAESYGNEVYEAGKKDAYNEINSIAITIN